VSLDRPEKIEHPKESVWDYPRPPRLEPTARRIRVFFNNVCIADSTQAYRVLETSHPPVYYLPPEDIQMHTLLPVDRATFCEWKGQAHYFNVQVGDKVASTAAWSYPEPTPSFALIRGYIAFYPSKMDECRVDDELVLSQPGDFYGGWITSDIIGPFKGAPGTRGW
jgi:uncharacterized protein (DUF427 family)